MILHLGVGIEPLKFGMTELEVMALLGEPDLLTLDPDDEFRNTVYQYNQLRLTLTFYSDEDDRLAYFRTTNPALKFNGQQIINQSLQDVFSTLEIKNEEWEKEQFFSFTSYCYEEKWIVLHEEYGRVTNFEMGAPRGGKHYDIIWPE
jgi:hypothetical protein